MIPGSMVFMGRLLITLIITSMILLPTPAQSTPQPKLILLSSSIVSRGTSVIIEYDAYRGEEGLNISFSSGEVLAATLVSTDGDTARYRLIYTVPHTVSFRAYSHSGGVRTAEGYADSNGYTGHWIREVGTPAPSIASHNASLDLSNSGEWTVALGQTVDINITIRGYTDSPVPSVILLTDYYETVTGVNEKIPAVLLDSSIEGSEVTYTFGVAYTLRTRYVYITLNSSYGFMGQTETSIVPDFQRLNNGFNYSVQKYGRYNDTRTFGTGESLNYTLTVENEANVSFSFKATENYSSDVEIPLEVTRAVDGNIVIYDVTSEVSEGMYLTISMTDNLRSTTEVIEQYVITLFDGRSYLRFDTPIVTSEDSIVLDYEVMNVVDEVQVTDITLYAKDWNKTLLIDENKVLLEFNSTGDQEAYFSINNSLGIVNNQSISLIWDVTPPSGDLEVSYSVVYFVNITASDNFGIGSIDLGYRGLKERVFGNYSGEIEPSIYANVQSRTVGESGTESIMFWLTVDLPEGYTNFSLTVTDLAGNTYETWIEITDEADPGVTTVLLISSGSVIVVAVSVILWKKKRS